MKKLPVVRSDESLWGPGIGSAMRQMCPASAPIRWSSVSCCEPIIHRFCAVKPAGRTESHPRSKILLTVVGESSHQPGYPAFRNAVRQKSSLPTVRSSTFSSTETQLTLPTDIVCRCPPPQHPPDVPSGLGLEVLISWRSPFSRWPPT